MQLCRRLGLRPQMGCFTASSGAPDADGVARDRRGCIGRPRRQLDRPVVGCPAPVGKRGQQKAPALPRPAGRGRMNVVDNGAAAYCGQAGQHMPVWGRDHCRSGWHPCRQVHVYLPLSRQNGPTERAFQNSTSIGRSRGSHNILHKYDVPQKLCRIKWHLKTRSR